MLRDVKALCAEQRRDAAQVGDRVFDFGEPCDARRGVKLALMPLAVVERDRFDRMPGLLQMKQQRGGIHAAGEEDDDFFHEMRSKAFAC